MNFDNDQIRMTFHVKGTAFSGASAFKPLLERLQASFLPSPTTMEVTDQAGKAIKGYLDSKVIKALDRRRYVVDLVNEEKGLNVRLNQSRRQTIVGISFPAADAQNIPASEIRALFVDLA